MLFLSALSFSLLQGFVSTCSILGKRIVFFVHFWFSSIVLLNIRLCCFHAKNLSTFPQIVTESIVTRRIRNIRSNAFYYTTNKIHRTMCDFLDFGLTFFLHYVYSGSCTITSKAKINVF